MKHTKKIGKINANRFLIGKPLGMWLLWTIWNRRKVNNKDGKHIQWWILLIAEDEPWDSSNISYWALETRHQNRIVICEKKWNISSHFIGKLPAWPPTLENENNMFLQNIRNHLSKMHCHIPDHQNPQWHHCENSKSVKVSCILQFVINPPQHSDWLMGTPSLLFSQ